MEDDILTIEEVAKYLRVSERTVYDWAQKGEIMSVQIKNILSPDRIIFINHSTKHDAIVELAHNLATAPQIKNNEELTSEILKREELMSTAIGRGIAIPHVRLSSVTDLVMSVGICKSDIIDFATLDDTPVKLMFMIAASYNQHAYYLQTLSFISSKLKNKELRDGLLNAKDAMEAYELLIK